MYSQDFNQTSQSTTKSSRDAELPDKCITFSDLPALLQANNAQVIDVAYHLSGYVFLPDERKTYKHSLSH